MKLLLTLLCFLCLSVSASFAQPEFGIKAGLTLSRFNEDVYKNLASFHGGFLLKHKLSNRFFIQPGLLYSGKGSDSDIAVDNIPIKFKLTYLSLPVLFGVESNNGFSVSLGTGVHYLLDSTMEFGENPYDNVPFSTLDISLNASVAYRFAGKFGIAFGYEYSIKGLGELNFTDINGAYLFSLENLKNRAMLFSVYYMIPGRK